MRFGVDEAGRGPVLGSLFVACVWADPAGLPAGIDDSKRLRPARRETLAASLRADNRISTAVVEVTPTRIDSPQTDLNTLTVDAMAKSIDQIVENGGTGLVDACDTDASRFGRHVGDATDTAVEIMAAHGADENYEIVGAASILAKVARDAHIDALADEYGPLGSGYPSDSATREILRDYVSEYDTLPPFARASWQTSQDVLDAAAQSELADF